MNAPVLIVGGGPVGTYSALLLAKYGVRSIVFERRETINPHPKSRSVSRRTMEILRPLGIRDEHLAPISLPPVWTQVLVYTTTLTGREIGRVRCPDFESVPIAESPSIPHMSSQEKIEQLLRDLVDDCDLIDFRGGTAVTAFAQSDHGCEIAVEPITGKSGRVEGEYALFADGASSQAREWLGVRMEGQSAIATVLDVHFDSDALGGRIKHRIAPLLFVASDGGTGVYQPIDGKSEWRCQIFAAGETADSIDAAAWIRATAGDDTLDVRLRSIRPWTMHSLMSDRFQVDRAFLLGDAAHVLPPTGGLGLNSGFQGAHNLIWKLAGVMHGWAGARLLATYDQERREVTRVSAETSFSNNVNFAAIGNAYRTGGDLEKALRQAESYGRFAGLDIGIRYARGAFCDDGTRPAPLRDTVATYDHSAAPGVRAPHVWLRRANETVSTLDLCANGFCLLSGADGGKWVNAAIEIGRKREIPILAFAINGAQSSLTGKDWAATYCVDESGAVLIRPDGHIAYRSKGNVENHSLALNDALAVCLCRDVAFG